MRRHTLVGLLVMVGLLVAAAAITVSSFTDLASLVDVLERGSWPWIIAGIAAHLAYFLVYAVLYRLGFAIVGVSSRTWSLVPVMFAGLFVNLIVPTGAGAAAVFVDDAVRRGEDGARVTVGVVLVLLLDLLTVIPFIAWGMAYLVQQRMFAPWQLLAALAFVLYVGLLGALLVLAHIRQSGVERVLGWILRICRWFRLPGPATDWPARTAAHFSEAASAIAATPGRLALAALAGLATHAVNALGLWLFLRGFGADVPIGGLIAAFAIGLVLHVIAVLPQLAPLAQAFMTATFVGIGVAAGPAVAAPLASRGMILGLPLALGLPFAMRLARALL